jgi:hypothetical protein
MCVGDGGGDGGDQEGRGRDDGDGISLPYLSVSLLVWQRAAKATDNETTRGKGEGEERKKRIERGVDGELVAEERASRHCLDVWCSGRERGISELNLTNASGPLVGCLLHASPRESAEGRETRRASQTRASFN